MSALLQEVVYFLHVGREWLQEIILLVVLALAGGVIGAMKRGYTGARKWLGSLFRAVVIGAVAGVILSKYDLDPGWTAATIIFVAFGAERIVDLADAAWAWASANPRGMVRLAYEWMVKRRIVIERRVEGEEHQDAIDEDTRRDG